MILTDTSACSDSDRRNLCVCVTTFGQDEGVLRWHAWKISHMMQKTCMALRSTLKSNTAFHREAQPGHLSEHGTPVLVENLATSVLQPCKACEAVLRCVAVVSFVAGITALYGSAGTTSDNTSRGLQPVGQD